MAKRAWSSFPRGNSRSGMLRSRTIPLHFKRHVPEEPFGDWHMAEIQPVNVHQLSHMILSPKVEKILATSVGLGSLHTGRLGSRLRRHLVLERQRVRDGRIESNEGHCTDTEWEAIRYV